MRPNSDKEFLRLDPWRHGPSLSPGVLAVIPNTPGPSDPADRVERSCIPCSVSWSDWSNPSNHQSPSARRHPHPSHVRPSTRRRSARLVPLPVPSVTGLGSVQGGGVDRISRRLECLRVSYSSRPLDSTSGPCGRHPARTPPHVVLAESTLLSRGTSPDDSDSDFRRTVDRGTGRLWGTGSGSCLVGGTQWSSKDEERVGQVSVTGS